MKISIIIPIYNVSAYIERCIKSVMSQTYQDIECILVNDVSPDDSIAIAERLIADYDGPIQFKILNREHNGGVSAARNSGTKAATGDYVYFLDSDDEITPDCIEKFSRPVLNDPTIEMVIGCFVFISYDSKNIPSEQPMQKQQLDLPTKEAVRKYFFSKQNPNVYACNKLMNRDFLIRNQLFFKEGIRWEDILWQFFYYKYLNHLYFISSITYKYYRWPTSFSKEAIKNKEFRANGFGIVFEEISKNLTAGDEAQEIKHYIRSFCLFYLDVPTSPVYKQVSSKFLKILKDNHCTKEWLLLKSVVILSKHTLARKAAQKAGDFLKIIKKLNRKK